MTDTSQSARRNGKPKLPFKRPSPAVVAQQFELIREVIAALRASEDNTIVLRLMQPILGSARNKSSPLVAEYNALIAECRRVECKKCKKARWRRVRLTCKKCKPGAYCIAVGELLSKLGEVYGHCKGRSQGRSGLSKREAAKQLAYRVRVAKKCNPRQPTRVPVPSIKRPAVATPAEPVAAVAPPKKAKRSTAKGEGETKLIGALTEYHRYAEEGGLNFEPIGNNELARRAGVDRATASAFFKHQFKGHSKYKVACAHEWQLINALKLMNGEILPHNLYGKDPDNQVERDG